MAIVATMQGPARDREVLEAAGAVVVSQWAGVGLDKAVGMGGAGRGSGGGATLRHFTIVASLVRGMQVYINFMCILHVKFNPFL